MKSPSELQQIIGVDGDSKHSRSSIEEHGQVQCSENELEHGSDKKLELSYCKKVHCKWKRASFGKRSLDPKQ
jgi:hypothetical protein